MATATGRRRPGPEGEPLGAGLRQGAGGRGGHAGRRPLPDAGRGGGARGDGAGLARGQGGLLPDLRLAGVSDRPAAAAAVEVPGPGPGGASGGGAAVAERQRRGPSGQGRAGAPAEAAASAEGDGAAAFGAHGRGDDGGQRGVRLAGGGGGPPPRPGPGARKACVGDGAKAVWAVFEFHLLAAGFIAILDFLQLLSHLYAAACAAEPKGTEAAWALYSQWLCWAWSGKVLLLLGGLRAVCKRLGPAPAGASEDDPRKVAADTLGYVGNNRGRMDYPEYRRLGLPISSAPVESAIKQLNRRVKGSEKFWLHGGAEAVLQVRAAYLSEDGRAERYWRDPGRIPARWAAAACRPAAAPQ